MKLVIVKLDIRHGDERLVATAIVPVQHLRRVATRTLMEDTLHIGHAGTLRTFVFVGLLVFTCERVEEAGRRKLLRISHDDELAAAKQRSNSILRTNLTGFIKNYEIKAWPLWMQELSD